MGGIPLQPLGNPLCLSAACLGDFRGSGLRIGPCRITGKKQCLFKQCVMEKCQDGAGTSAVLPQAGCLAWALWSCPSAVPYRRSGFPLPAMSESPRGPRAAEMKLLVYSTRTLSALCMSSPLFYLIFFYCVKNSKEQNEVCTLRLSKFVLFNQPYVLKIFYFF